ncbi:hypothetical protein JKP88DRAFT_350279 [Tribonema minus]|uniref:type II protein arginine methyltransferase n=1 Tax=Tribonema minus TaxID=303371 RepID=A0A835YP18_9STRA|nr:hypothetical protein JKP88DRAFT_350279 [Tribonema minus]
MNGTLLLALFSFPKHRLLLADFDSVGEPSVTRNDPKTGFTEDQSSYLLPPGSADLCFPTDFGSLKQVYSQVTGRSGGSVHVMKQSAFFELQKTEAAAAQTRNGYNPMLEDFGNYSMLIGQ